MHANVNVAWFFNRGGSIQKSLWRFTHAVLSTLTYRPYPLLPVRLAERAKSHENGEMNIVPAPALLRLIQSNLARGASAALLGIDVGTRWVGVGVTDRDCRFAVPLTTLERVPGTWLGLAKRKLFPLPSVHI